MRSSSPGRVSLRAAAPAASSRQSRRSRRPPDDAPRLEVRDDLGDPSIRADEDRVDREAHEEHVDRRRALDPESLAGGEGVASEETDGAVAHAARHADAVGDDGAAGQVLDAHDGRR